MKKIGFAACCGIVVAALAGCATPPDKIAGVPTGGECTPADRERLAILYTKQHQAARNDALGVFLVGMPLATMGGADNETEIAILKGRCGDPNAPRRQG